MENMSCLSSNYSTVTNGYETAIEDTNNSIYYSMSEDFNNDKTLEANHSVLDVNDDTLEKEFSRENTVLTNNNNLSKLSVTQKLQETQNLSLLSSTPKNMGTSDQKNDAFRANSIKIQENKENTAFPDHTPILIKKGNILSPVNVFHVTRKSFIQEAMDIKTEKDMEAKLKIMENVKSVLIAMEEINTNSDKSIVKTTLLPIKPRKSLNKYPGGIVIPKPQIRRNILPTDPTPQLRRSIMPITKKTVVPSQEIVSKPNIRKSIASVQTVLPKAQMRRSNLPTLNEIPKPQMRKSVMPIIGEIPKPQMRRSVMPILGEIPKPQIRNSVMQTKEIIPKPQMRMSVMPVKETIPKTEIRRSLMPKLELKNNFQMKTSILGTIPTVFPTLTATVPKPLPRNIPIQTFNVQLENRKDLKPIISEGQSKSLLTKGTEIKKKDFVKQNIRQSVMIRPNSNLNVKTTKLALLKPPLTTTSNTDVATKLFSLIKLNSGNIECEICKKSFRLKSSLLSHKKTHDLNKIQKCQYCDKQFSIKNALDNHLKEYCQKIPEMHRKKLLIKSDIDNNKTRKSFYHEISSKSSDSSIKSSSDQLMPPPSVTKFSGKKIAHSGISRTPKKVVKCNICDLQFLNIFLLADHSKLHLKNTNILDQIETIIA